MTVVALDCVCDDLTSNAKRLREANVYPAIARQLGLDDLAEDTTAPQLIAALRDADVRMFVGSGHGTALAFGYADGPPVLAANTMPPECLTGRIVHLLACDAARGLGPDLVGRGCAAFIGYADLVLYDKPIVGLAIRCDSEIERVLLAGGTAADAVHAAKESYASAARAIAGRSSLYAQYLLHDGEILTLLGQGTARLIPG